MSLINIYLKLITKAWIPWMQELDVVAGEKA